MLEITGSADRKFSARKIDGIIRLPGETEERDAPSKEKANQSTEALKGPFSHAFIKQLREEKERPLKVATRKAPGKWKQQPGNIQAVGASSN